MAQNAKNAKGSSEDGFSPFTPEGRTEATRLYMATSGKKVPTKIRNFLKGAPSWAFQGNGMLRSPVRRRLASASGEDRGLFYTLEAARAGIDVTPQMTSIAQRYADQLTASERSFFGLE